MKKLFLGLLCALLSFSAQAQFSGAGSGTSEDPYQITNADELAEMAYFLSRTGVYFQLMNDIDLTQWIVDNNPTQGWSPIGVDSDRFKGVLNGDGHTISGLYINRPNFANVGLFGYVESASISNLEVTGSSVTGGNSTGGLIGRAYGKSLISHCSVTLSGAGIVGTQNVGGLLGYGQGTSDSNGPTIQGCEYRGKVYAFDNEVGGLIGRADYSSISDCSAYADVESAAHDNVGGIVGYTYLSLTCTNCKHQGTIVGGKESVGGVIGQLCAYTADATVSNCSHSGKIVGNNNVGGIIGRNFFYLNRYLYHLIIRQCFVNSEIKGILHVGGILGYTDFYSDNNGSYPYSGHVNISNCYAYANIVGTQFVGGIVGEMRSRIGRGEVQYCYMTGKIAGEDCVGGMVGRLANSNAISSNCVIASSISGTSNVGRVCGYKSSGTIGAVGSQQGNRAYGLCEMIINGSKESVQDNEMNGTAISLSALKGMAAYSGIGWDFTDTWTINNGKTFPYLRWEKRINTIELNRTDLIMSLGESATLVATIAPVDADLMELDWSSSDESVATVADGFVQALAEGRTTITAKAKDGSEIEAVCLITVTNNNDSRPADFDNVVYMESFTANAGDEIAVPILMKNQVAGDIINYEFDLYLPEGISAVLDDGEAIVEVSGDRAMTKYNPMYGEINDDGSIKVYSYSRRVFSGTDGEIATILLKVADDAADGVYHIVIRNISMESVSNDDPYTVGRFNLSAGIGDLIKTITDGESYQEAEDFSVDKLRFSRTFNNTNWQALYVPFSIPVATLEAHGLKVAELNDTHQYFDTNTGALIQTEVEFRYVTSGETQPNYPYVIMAENTGTVEFELENVQLKATVETEIECSTTRQTFKIKGTYTGISGEEMLRKNYYAMGGGTLIRVESEAYGLKPQRWYMEIVNKDGSEVDYFAPSIRVKIDGIDEESTGISNCVEQGAEAPVYDLQGRQIKDGKLKSGMYVKDHKKIIVL